MSSLNLVMGVNAIGKTSWLLDNLEEDFQCIVDKKAIRLGLVPEQAKLFSKEVMVNNEFIRQVIQNLSEDYDVFAEDTFTSRASRQKFIQRVPHIYDELNIYYIKKDISFALKQNEYRKNTRLYVEPTIIRQEYYHLVEPTYDEGFDNIKIIK